MPADVELYRELPGCGRLGWWWRVRVRLARCGCLRCRIDVGGCRGRATSAIVMRTPTPYRRWRPSWRWWVCERCYGHAFVCVAQKIADRPAPPPP